MLEFARLNKKKNAIEDTMVHSGQGGIDFEDMGDESPLFRCVFK